MNVRKQKPGAVHHAVLALSVLAIGAAGVAVSAVAGLLPGSTSRPQRDAGDDEVLIVHEWGTFTAMQDAEGNALGGLNTDDEPVPAFVHNLSPRLLEPSFRTRSLSGSKGLPLFFAPQVTMRLETPVMYFHPPKSQSEPLRLDVEVAFRGGWLSEFYPRGESTAPGLRNLRLSPQTVGTLRWSDLLVGTEGQGPETSEPVWLEPRDVRAATVSTPDGESEKYLFYRGVGNVETPVRIVTDVETNTLSIYSRFGELLPGGRAARIDKLWLVDVRPNGELAFRTLDPATVAAEPETAEPETDEQVTKVSATFGDADYRHDSFADLRREMHAALVADGLYADEADAMLDTWRQAYFRSSGLRLFFLMPRQWTDDRLPLALSRPAKVERVMMARIEIVSARQRELVQKISQAEKIDASWMLKIPESVERIRFFRGDANFGDLGVEIPADYRAYLDLGRFRNAILISELRRQPTPALKSFIEAYQLPAEYSAASE